MHKKLLSLVLALCLAVSLIPAAFAQELGGECGEQTRWSFDEATAIMTISGTGATDEYVQEEFMTAPWYDLREQVKHLVVEEGITVLGEGCFMDFTNLETVRLPGTLTHIGHYCFANAEKLAEVTLPQGLKRIGLEAFRRCISLTAIELPNTLGYIDPRAFEDCTGLTDAYIRSDPNLKTLLMGNAIFRGCTGLEEIRVEEGHVGLKSIDGVLYGFNKNGLILVQYPLGRKAESYTLPEGTLFLNDFSLENALHLRSVTIPASVYYVRPRALVGQALEEVRFLGNAPEFTEEALGDLPMTVYYPIDNATWTQSIMNAQGPHITWAPFNPANPFRDVPLGSFYEEPVLWALEKGVTTGASADTFNPDGQCLRAQVVTFLWRAEGCPKPDSEENPFVDVKPGDFYYDAVLWAVGKGITTGSDATHFNPMGVCNRAQVVTFLYRAFEKPPVEDAGNPFTDVPAGAFYEAPVLWAVTNGITNGLSSTQFGPDAACNRAQVVTFLYRAYN